MGPPRTARVAVDNPKVRTRNADGHHRPPPVPVIPSKLSGLSASGVLALQRMVGNRLTTELVTGTGAGSVIQRKLAFTSEIFGSMRSSTGKLKGVVTKDSLWQIQAALRAYEKSTSPEEELATLKTIEGMCLQYIDKHKGIPEDTVKVQSVQNLVDEIVEEFEAESLRAKTHGEALDVYLRDLAASEVLEKGDRGQLGPSAFTQLRTRSGAAGAKNVAAGGAALGPDDTAAHKIAEETGLSVAHLAAIRVFGAVSGDFEYMNPVMAGNDAWLHSADKSTFQSLRTERAAKAEGSLHAAVALEGMMKLPTQESELWRGENRIPEWIPKKGETITLGTIQSWSPDKGIAKSFLSRHPTKREVMFHLPRCTQGRKVSQLKGEGMSKESELTLLPGYRYKVVGVIDGGWPQTVEIECAEVPDSSSSKGR